MKLDPSQQELAEIRNNTLAFATTNSLRKRSIVAALCDSIPVGDLIDIIVSYDKESFAMYLVRKELAVFVEEHRNTYYERGHLILSITNAQNPRIEDALKEMSTRIVTNRAFAKNQYFYAEYVQCLECRRDFIHKLSLHQLHSNRWNAIGEYTNLSDYLHYQNHFILCGDCINNCCGCRGISAQIQFKLHLGKNCKQCDTYKCIIHNFAWRRVNNTMVPMTSSLCLECDKIYNYGRAILDILNSADPLASFRDLQSNYTVELQYRTCQLN